jgi:hypothetical protein
MIRAATLVSDPGAGLALALVPGLAGSGRGSLQRTPEQPNVSTFYFV